MAVRKREPDTFLFHPFEGLKDIIETRRVEIAPAPPAEKKPATPTDEELFARAMAGVREIREFRDIRTTRQKAATQVRKIGHEHDAMQALRELVAGRGSMNLADTQEYVQWINSDFRRDLAGLLHEGRFSVKDFLDLHGHTLEEAEEAVAIFLRESLRRGHKCVKIIHGRGLRSPRGPVLKEALIRSLSIRHRRHVAAFVTARQCDGGLGALYVLLK